MDPIIIVFAVLIAAMFIMSSRTRKKQREALAFRDHLEPGQQVMTGSGMFGTVVEVSGDAITLASPSGDESVWLRAAIAKLAEPPYADEDEEGEEETLEVPDDASALIEEEPSTTDEDDGPEAQPGR